VSRPHCERRAGGDAWCLQVAQYGKSRVIRALRIVPSSRDQAESAGAFRAPSGFLEKLIVR
jgi:hypothetical protein